MNWMGIALTLAQKEKAPTSRGLFIGGEGGIRTLDTLPYTHFPGVLLQPLGHFSKTGFTGPAARKARKVILDVAPAQAWMPTAASALGG